MSLYHDSNPNSAFVSSKNSSTASLGGGATYTGTAEDCSQYASVKIFVDSDVDGTLKMQLSSDGTNWDRSKNVVIDQTIGSGHVHTLNIVSQYFRIVYVNGASAQGHFRLQTIFHKNAVGFLTSGTDEKISKVNDAQIVRVGNDPIFDFSRSLYSDKIAIHKFGANDLIPAGRRDIWSYGATDTGNTDYPWPDTAETITVESSSVNDDAAPATGAQTVCVQGLDTNWDLVEETIALDGTTPVTSSTTFTRVYRVYVLDVGTYTGSNDGAITVKHSTSGDVLAYIAAGLGQTQLTMYTIPNGYTGYIRHAHASVSAGANKDATIIGWRRENADDQTAPFSGGAKREFHKWEDLSGVAELDFYSLPSFPEKTDIWFTSEGNAGSKASVVYDLYLVKDDNPTNPQ